MPFNKWLYKLTGVEKSYEEQLGTVKSELKFRIDKLFEILNSPEIKYRIMDIYPKYEKTLEDLPNIVMGKLSVSAEHSEVELLVQEIFNKVMNIERVTQPRELSKTTILDLLNKSKT